MTMTINSSTNDLTAAQLNYKTDRRRILSRKKALFNLFSDRNWHPNYECARVGGLSFQGSIFAFRNAGWIIESRPMKGGVWEYQLRGKSAQPRAAPALSRPQRRVADEFLLGVRKAYGDAGVERLRRHLSPWLKEAT